MPGMCSEDEVAMLVFRIIGAGACDSAPQAYDQRGLPIEPVRWCYVKLRKRPSVKTTDGVTKMVQGATATESYSYDGRRQ
jgi:hypothetical protein